MAREHVLGDFIPVVHASYRDRARDVPLSQADPAVVERFVLVGHEELKVLDARRGAHVAQREL
jgi:hypothetical protein